MRELTVNWIGPFSYRNAFYKVEAGLYLIFVGQHPIYISGTNDISSELGRHAIYSPERVRPGDMVGRELIDYSRRYNLRLTAKLARVYEGETLITDEQTLDDVARLLNYSRPFPCNQYGRQAYQGTQALSLTNTGKYYPLDPHCFGDPMVHDPQP